MKTYICQICGDAYIGEDRPSECPFCGAQHHFIKDGSEARPIVNDKIELSEISKKNLEETLGLEMKANAIYLCMAGKADNYERKAMYKRLAKVELEHANIACKLMGIALPQAGTEPCSEDDVENFQKTIELEEHATNLYAQFAKAATEQNIKIFFTALMQVEADHIKLIKNYL
ncbi:MAG: ferritin [Candidatus Moranbacteria bacterium]|nr:ferritin [Candidatus Moranbacteria bacterium]